MNDCQGFPIKEGDKVLIANSRYQEFNTGVVEKITAKRVKVRVWTDSLPLGTPKVPWTSSYGLKTLAPKAVLKYEWRDYNAD